jgi:hypothetical protein
MREIKLIDCVKSTILILKMTTAVLVETENLRLAWLIPLVAHIGSEVPTAVPMKSPIFWDIMPLKVKRHFRGPCRLHLQGRRISQARNQREAGGKHILFVHYDLCQFLVS